MKLRLYNTLSQKIEVFSPIDSSNVRMYVCGPTVYDRAHLGNARPAVVFDVLYRVLKKIYPKVTYVRNITDIDDKIYKTAIDRKISIYDLTKQTIDMYHKDIGALHVIPPDIEPLATEHINEIIEAIEKIIDSGHGYISNGHVYFYIESFKEYGTLSHKKIDELLSGVRVNISESKRNPLDFVLWKPVDENFNFGWESPWGKGRPGWHIECSAMSNKYLGEYFDIHGGGIDLVFPHHENEIAQSCAISHNQIPAKYWIHNGHLNINGSKMSKSKGNFFTVEDLLKKYDGEVIRLTLLMSHFSAPMNFSEDSLRQASQILNKWYNAVKDYNPNTHVNAISFDVFNAILDNLNTPKAIAILHTLIDEINKTMDQEKMSVFINTARSILGIMNKTHNEWFKSSVDQNTELWISEMIEKRNYAKKNMDYRESDRIRNELLEKGITIEDTKNGTIWKRT